jgi:hypothetical protein
VSLPALDRTVQLWDVHKEDVDVASAFTGPGVMVFALRRARTMFDIISGKCFHAGLFRYKQVFILVCHIHSHLAFSESTLRGGLDNKILKYNIDTAYTSRVLRTFDDSYAHHIVIAQ